MYYIDNVELESFLKGEKFVTNRKKSNELTSKKPSIAKKHIKSGKKVKLALDDLQENRNWSWHDEMAYRRKDVMNKEAIFYRGNSITTNEMYEKSSQLVKSLSAAGIKKGDEILACMSNTPEAVYLLDAAAQLGAVVNFVGASFDHDFLKDITSSKKRKVFIGTDDQYHKISDIIKDSNIDYKVLVSLTDSLPNNQDNYSYYDDDYYHFENKVPEFKKQDSSLLSWDEFIALGKNHIPKLPHVGLDDPFTITYTSGSTKIGWPKPLTHAHRHYTSIARVHDPGLSRMPAMRNMRGLAHIPLHSNTNIASSISDPLAQTCSVACEPIYHPNFLARSILINKTAFVPATPQHWINAHKQYELDPKVHGQDMGFLVNCVAVGGGTSKNEEKFINDFFKKVHAGADALPKPLSPICLSLGGGDCEHGGLFFTLFHKLRQQIALTKDARQEYGLTPFQLADLAVLRPDGTECDFNEYGRLVANSDCTMQGYSDMPEATQEFYVTDAYGRVWGDCNVWAYIGKNGNVRMKGRMGNEFPLSSGQQIPTFFVTETAENDLNNILSCETVLSKTEDEVPILVSHIELLPGCETPIEQVLWNADQRCRGRFSEELADRVFYRIHSSEESFPLTGSLKRNIPALENEPFDSRCVKPVMADGEIILTEGPSYVKNSTRDDAKQFIR